MVLIINNVPAHPSVEKLTSLDGKVTFVVLPRNTTSILQPMDQGVLETLKWRYKKAFLRHTILENHAASSLSVQEIVNSSIKGDIYWIFQAWEDVSEDSLKNTWNKQIPRKAEPPESYVGDLLDKNGILVLRPRIF